MFTFLLLLLLSTSVFAAVPTAMLESPNTSLSITTGTTIAFKVTASHDTDLLGVVWYSGNGKPFVQYVDDQDVVKNTTDRHDGDTLSATFTYQYPAETSGSYIIKAQPFAAEDDKNITYGSSVKWSIVVNPPLTSTVPRATAKSPNLSLDVNERETITFEVHAEHETNLKGIAWYTGNNKPFLHYIDDSDVIINEVDSNSGKALSATFTYKYTFDTLESRTIKAQPLALTDSNDEIYGTSAKWNITVKPTTTPTANIKSPDATVIITEGEKVKFEVNAAHHANLQGVVWHTGNNQHIVQYINDSDVTINDIDTTHGGVLSATFAYEHEFDTSENRTIKVQPLAFTDNNDEIYGISAKWNITVNPATSTTVPIANIISPDATVIITEGETVKFEVSATHHTNLQGIVWYTGSNQTILQHTNDPDVTIHKMDATNNDVTSASFAYEHTFDKSGSHVIKAQPLALSDDDDEIYGSSVGWDVSAYPISDSDNDPTKIAQTRYMHVDGANDIIGDPLLEQHLLDYSRQHNIVGYIFYNLNQLLPNSRHQPQAQALNDFILRAKADYDIKEIGFALQSFDQVDKVITFTNNYAATIDFFQSEYEFWNNNTPEFTYSGYIDLLEYMHEQGEQQNPPIAVVTYLGHLSDNQEIEQATDIISLVDRVLLSCYVHDTKETDENYIGEYLAEHSGEYTYYRCQNRLSWFADAARNMTTTKEDVNVEIWPIFSAEYRKNCYCTGPWLETHGMQAAEEQFSQDYLLESGNWGQYLTIKGFVYYSYTFIQQFIK